MASLDERDETPYFRFDPESVNTYGLEWEWKWALDEISEKLQPMIKRFNEPEMRFTLENSALSVLPFETVNQRCRKIVGSDKNKNLFACNTQDRMRPEDDDPCVSFMKPQSTTYLSENWGSPYIYEAMLHELSHQAITTVGQMALKNHRRIRDVFIPSLSDSAFDAFNCRLKNLNQELDANDSAWVNAANQIGIKRKFDVFPGLDSAISDYFFHIDNRDSGGSND